MEEKKCVLLQQDDEYSNVYDCSNCHNTFFWGDEPDDIKNSQLAYCPFCGAKIENIEFITYEEDD